MNTIKKPSIHSQHKYPLIETVTGETGYIIPVSAASKYDDTYYFKAVTRPGKIGKAVFCELFYDRYEKNYSAIYCTDFCKTRNFSRDSNIFVGFTY